MIKKIQQDFIYFLHEFKDNYRKGVHRLRTILASRAQAQAFVSNAGGVAVVLGYEPSAPDKNAQELYALLAASPYIDDAVQTFLGSIYEAGAESQDAMYSDSARCLEILHDPVMARAAGAGAVSAGKWIATLAGQSCNLYRDMNAVAASDIAMTAVAASETAMEAVISSTIALNAVAASKTAMTAVAANETAMVAVAASRVAMSAIIGNSTALNAVVTSSVAMAAVIGNSTALNAVVSSSTAMAAVIGNSAALNAVVSSQTAMAAIAASQTAMAAVAASDVAVAAVYGSAVAVDAVKANETAWATLTGATSAVMGKAAAKLAGLNPADYAAMAAIASSSTAMAAVATSDSAIRAMVASTAAKTALIANNNNLQSVANTWWKTVQSGFTLVQSQKDDDGVTSANSVNAKYIMFAIPGGYNNGSGITNCFHGHNGAAAGSASGSYTDTAKRKVLLGGGTFTETNDGMVRTWVYSI